MNLIFVITSSDKDAKGGHFRSCLTIARSLQRRGAIIKIVNIGVVPSPVFRQEYVDVEYIDINAFNWPLRLFSMLKVIKACPKGSRILAFDFFSFFIIRTVCFFTKHPFGYFRCGGPNFKYFPFSRWIFCFSRESYSFFVDRFPSSFIYLFPNRVEKRSDQSNGRLRDILKNNHPIVLRIGRLVANYSAINDVCLNLSRLLNEKNILHNMVFIGYADDYNSDDFIRFKRDCDANANVRLLTDPEFTENAARFLSEANLVIGTGRGAMEAVVENRLVAVFSRSHDIPVLLESQEIFEASLTFNFSLRNNLSNVNCDINKENIISLFSNHTYASDVLEFVHSRRKYFDIDEIADEYLSVFARMSYDNEVSLKDYLKHFALMFLPKALSLR